MKKNEFYSIKMYYKYPEYDDKNIKYKGVGISIERAWKDDQNQSNLISVSSKPTSNYEENREKQQESRNRGNLYGQQNVIEQWRPDKVLPDI